MCGGSGHGSRPGNAPQGGAGQWRRSFQRAFVAVGTAPPGSISSRWTSEGLGHGGCGTERSFEGLGPGRANSLPASWDLGARAVRGPQCWPQTGPSAPDTTPLCCSSGDGWTHWARHLVLGTSRPPGAPDHTPRGTERTGLSESTLPWKPPARQLPEPRRIPGSTSCWRRKKFLASQGLPGHPPTSRILMEPPGPSSSPGALSPAFGRQTLTPAERGTRGLLSKARGVRLELRPLRRAAQEGPSPRQPTPGELLPKPGVTGASVSHGGPETPRARTPGLEPKPRCAAPRRLPGAGLC